MVVSIRPILLGLAWFAVAAVVPCRAADDPAPSPPGAQGPAAQPYRAIDYALPGEEPAQPFVPLHPRTVEDRQQVEAIRDYSVARALEDRRSWAEAIALLEDALKIEPDSIAVLKRLSRLCFALGRTEQALQYSRRVLDAEPGDTDTISRLIIHYDRKKDAPGAESLLKSVLANPKLDNHSPGHLLAEFELGKLYEDKLKQPDKAADAFAAVVDALDHKAANRLSPNDLRRILGGEEATAYLEFGDVFLETKRYEQAIKAYQRGLVYDSEHSLLQLRLAETLLKSGKGQEALNLVEHYLKRQPQATEGYELLAKILTALKREGEITPRLEAAAKIDSKNLPLQYALADRYREAGQVDKAESLYKSLLAAQPTAQGYGALAASLLKRKRSDELLKVLADAVTKPGGVEAVKPQIEAIAADRAYANDVLDVGLKLLSASPPALEKVALNVLDFIVKSLIKDLEKQELNSTRELEKLLAVERLMLKENPSPLVFREVADTLRRLKKYDEVAAVIEQLMATFPDEKNARLLDLLSQFRRVAGKYDAAIVAAREALKLEPNDGEAQMQLAVLLSQTGKLDEGLEVARGAVKNDPSNPEFNRQLGGLLTQFGRNDESIALYKGLLDRFPNNEELVRVAHSGLSVVYVNQGEFAKGEAELEILFQRSPDEAGVNNDLGYLYAEQGKNLEKAEAMVRKALQEEPDNYAYLDSLGWVLFKRGKFEEALVPLEKAATKVADLPNGGDATILEHLGDVYFRLNQSAKAKATWEQAEHSGSKATPPDKRLPEIRKKLESLKKLGQAHRNATGETP